MRRAARRERGVDLRPSRPAPHRTRAVMRKIARVEHPCTNFAIHCVRSVNRIQCKPKFAHMCSTRAIPRTSACVRCAMEVNPRLVPVAYHTMEEGETGERDKVISGDRAVEGMLTIASQTVTQSGSISRVQEKFNTGRSTRLRSAVYWLRS